MDKRHTVPGLLVGEVEGVVTMGVVTLGVVTSGVVVTLGVGVGSAVEPLKNVKRKIMI